MRRKNVRRSAFRQVPCTKMYPQINMVDYSKWDKWARELEDDDDEMEQRFHRELAKMTYEARQGKPMTSEPADQKPASNPTVVDDNRNPNELPHKKTTGSK